jgi:hypothetical protein
VIVGFAVRYDRHSMPEDDLQEAEQAERLGDAAEARQAAAGYYREAQRLLLPAGVVWTDRESYDRRMEAFERIQQKLYGLEGRANFILPVAAPKAEPPAEAPAVSDKEAGPLPPATPDLPVWNFSPGLVVRIARAFTDFDGQEIRAGEVLHFIDGNYFPYDGGHTLTFAEKTIRLATIADENVPIIENAGNAWFQPLR